MSIAVRASGAALVLLGLAGYPILESTLSPDGRIESAVYRTIIVAFQIGLVAVGLYVAMRPPRLRRPELGEVLLVAVSTVFALGLGEAALRFFDVGRPQEAAVRVGQREDRTSGGFVRDENTGWRMRPGIVFEWMIEGHLNTYRANGQGFRSDREFVPSGEPLIAVVGDSFTWGTGVSYAETFGSLLEEELSGVVFNFAMPGFGIDQMWMSVRHQVLPLDPSLVVVAFIDADFERSLQAFRETEGFNKPRFVIAEGDLRLQQPPGTASRVIDFVRSRSFLWGASEILYERANAVEDSEWWVLNARILEAIAEDATGAGVPLLFVRLPEQRPESFEELERHMAELGLEFLDLEEQTRARGSPTSIHYPDDGHINAEGHRFVAGEIIRWIREEQPLGRSFPFL